MERRSLDVLVLSDVHLGTYGCKAKELCIYLQSVNPSILILNGDFIDGWQFSKRYFPAAHMAVIREVFHLMTNGTRVFYITGNHDECFRRYTDISMGNFVLTDKLVLEIDQKMTWIFHGDVFDHTTKGAAKFWAKLGSKGYGLLIVVNKCINSMLKALGRDRISLSKKVMDGVNKAIVKVNEFETIVGELAIQKKYDYVICGHTHKPKQSTIFNGEGSVVYMNSGDWVENCTALEYAKKQWKLFEFNEADYPPIKIESVSNTPNVMTDEINLFIQSLAI